MGNKNKWMLTPTQPNWEAIYQELNTNGIQNLKDLPMNIFQQIQNGMDVNSIPSLGKPINGDSLMDKHWLNNTTVGDMLDHYVERGYIDKSNIAPDNMRRSVSELKKDLTQQTDEWIGYKSNNYKNSSGYNMPIDGSNLDQFKDLTVGDMLNYSETHFKEYDSIKNWTDVERKIKREIPSYVDGSNLSEWNGITIGDMLDYSSEKGINIDNLLPDSERISPDSIKDISQMNRDDIKAIYDNANEIHTSRYKQAENIKVQKKINELNKQWYKQSTEEIDKKIKFSQSAIDVMTENSEELADNLFEQFNDNYNRIQKTYGFSDIDTSQQPKSKRFNLKKGATSYKVNGDSLSNIQYQGRYNGNKIYANEKYMPVVKEKLEAATNSVVREGTEEVGNSTLKKLLSFKNIGTAVNLGIAVNDYKQSREEGKGVAGSLLKAGTQYAMGEVLGAWMIPLELIKAAPTIASSAFETASTSVRQMNSITRLQTFGNTHFQDTQQLATMRQSGMELAKMSQYNLQQTLMGNEAEYLHKL